jgi:2-polyprenyl-6-methoxyphenol hydroxylase-like FAD-dependent oxidoreductase
MSMGNMVLVVGAGPVGLTMAAELARYGVPVRIVDRAQQRTDQSRALMVWSRTLELLDRSGCGGAFVSAGMKVKVANIVADGKAIGRIDLGTVATTHPYVLMLPQSETERLLEEHLRSFGIGVERGVDLVSFVESQDGVESVLLHTGGLQEKVQSGWVIGCDGARSTVRHGMKKVFRGDAQPSGWILADVRLEGVDTPGEIDVGWHPEGVLVVMPIDGERYRVIADVGASQTDKGGSEPSLSQVQAILDARGRGGITASDPISMGRFHINERKVAEYRSGRVFLVGDSAHVHSPAGGQGMNTGMQDAFNLAWKLALVWRGMGAEEPLLGSYSLERSAVADQVLRNTGRISSLAVLRGEMKQSVRNYISSLMFGLSMVRDALAETFSEVSVEYPTSPLTRTGRHAYDNPAAGERAPLRRGEPAVGAGDTPRFAVCADVSTPAAKHGAGVLLGLYGNLLEDEVRPPFHAGGLWLLRPDGYVALATRNDGWDEIAAYLDRIAGRRS